MPSYKGLYKRDTEILIKTNSKERERERLPGNSCWTLPAIKVSARARETLLNFNVIISTSLQQNALNWLTTTAHNQVFALLLLE